MVKQIRQQAGLRAPARSEGTQNTTALLRLQKRALPNTPAKHLTHRHQTKKEFRPITTFLHRTGRNKEKKKKKSISSKLSPKWGQHHNTQPALAEHHRP